jgi:2-polyprenyl-6-methoxyphenol hydroxylase-like FAD-dependent oxidoreductase
LACSGPTEVLIIGAGPTGLVLALWLNRLGVRLRIVDRAPGTGEASRALGIQARTLEFYQAFGLAESIVAEGLPVGAINLWVRKRKQARILLEASAKA